MAMMKNTNSHALGKIKNHTPHNGLAEGCVPLKHHRPHISMGEGCVHVKQATRFVQVTTREKKLKITFQK
jgi:hypothetical protein